MADRLVLYRRRAPVPLAAAAVIVVSLMLVRPVAAGEFFRRDTLRLFFRPRRGYSA